VAIEFTTINGENAHLDTGEFENSLREKYGETCEDAKVYLFNNFPVVVSEESFIDLLIIIALKDIGGNYYRLSNKKYLKNIIMPINFIVGYEDDGIEFEDGELLINEAEINFTSEVIRVKKRFEKYLLKKCNLSGAQLNVHPLFHIKNNQNLALDNHLVAPNFSFNEFDRYLFHTSESRLVSNYGWLQNKEYDSYKKVTEDVRSIVQQASFDSEIGYLTKQKIERIGKKVARSTKKEEALNNSLVIISGKAGTGKTTELLTLMSKSLSNEQNALFLTYNKLLVFDLAKTIRAVADEIGDTPENLGKSTIMTLHAFFYRVSKALGVLHVMSEDRIDQLTSMMRKRLLTLFKYIKLLGDNKYLLSDYEALIESIQNHKRLDIGTKELGIDLVKFALYNSKTFVNENDRDEVFKNFYDRQLKLLERIATNEIFLADYYGVLKNSLHQINNPENYYDQNRIETRGKLLSDIFNLKDKHFDENNNFTKEAFVEKKNRKIGGFRRKRTLCVDEAQDCHTLEKDILIKIFGHENMVVANGGVEQLIRHVELCNWEYSQGKNLNPKKFWTTKKSYRVKKHLLEFCSFVAQKYQINLDLEPYEEEGKENPDVGSIIVDYRKDLSEKDIDQVIQNLDENAKVHGCSNYESTLIMLETVGFKNKIENNSQKKDSEGEQLPQRGIVNEYGNIYDDVIHERDEWDFIKNPSPSDSKYELWDGTKEDKSEDGIPTPNDIRVIFYESCRGLEAWNAMCFSIDKFFDKKYEEDDAEKYLVTHEAEIGTPDMYLSNDDRKKMYAATWILMATTRAMDSLYLHVEDKDSEFAKTINEFLGTSPSNVRVINGIE